MITDSVEKDATPLETVDDTGSYYSPDTTGIPVESTPPPTQSRNPKLSKTVVIAIIAVAALAVLGGVAFTLFKKPQAKAPAPTQVTINTQSLDNGTLNKLTAQAAPNGDKQQLTISPDTLFKGAVTVQGSTQVEKDLNVRGSTSLQGSVTITSNLAVRDSLSVGGTLSAPTLSIGTLATSTITASGNIRFGGHLEPTGAQPGATAGSAALGGSVQISGNDTAGTVTISVGNNASLAGELATIRFNKAFATTPKVQLTPVNAESAALRYYVARTSGFLTINTASPPVAGASYVFDYLVTQ